MTRSRILIEEATMSETRQGDTWGEGLGWPTCSSRRLRRFLLLPTA